MKQKLEDYSVMGIPEIWVIDPEDRTWSRYDGKQLILVDSFSIMAKDIHFDMNEIEKLVR